MDIKIETATVTARERSLKEDWTIEIEDGGHWVPEDMAEELGKFITEEILKNVSIEEAREALQELEAREREHKAEEAANKEYDE